MLGKNATLVCLLPDYQHQTTVRYFLEAYQPTNVPQITTLKISGIRIPFTVKSLNNGFPRTGLTTTQIHNDGNRPKSIPFATVGCFTNAVKSKPQIPPLMTKRIAAIIWSTGGFVPNIP